MIQKDYAKVSVTRFSPLYSVFLFFAVTFFLVVNIETGILNLVIRSAFSPLSQDTLFPLTYSLAIVSFIMTMYWTRKSGLVSLPYSIGVPFLWVIFFEILWQNSFIFSGAFKDNIVSEMILMSWLLVGCISYPIWRADKFTLAAFLTFSLTWVAWVATGYQQMPLMTGYIFNISLKIGAFLTIIVLIFPRRTNTGHGKNIRLPA
jgi:hypothetical protein